MKRFLIPALALTIVTGLAFGCSGCSFAQESGDQPQLTIGSKAPALDIEHWLTDGNGFFKPVKKLKKGDVYVVEFWATWCPPCVASMPHLVELQNKYRGQGVQIISISDEDLETVEEFMETEHPQAMKPGVKGKEPIIVSELTAAYCLTADPDGSVSADYMQASGQNGIPCAFIVGKTGLIEWIGHPMSMDEPLEKVVGDSWDREAFKEQLIKEQQFELAVRGIMTAYQSGDLKKAIVKVDEAIEGDFPEQQKEMLGRFRIQLQFESGDLNEEVLAFFRSEMKKNAKEPARAIQFAMMLANSAKDGADLGPLGKDAIDSLDAVSEEADKPMLPVLYNTQAQLHQALGNTKAAIVAQQKAIDSATGRQRERLEAFMDELVGKEDDKSSDNKAEEKEPALAK